MARALTFRPREGEDGFSLIEILIVTIIIGILAGIAIPVFLGQRKKGFDSQSKSDLQGVATAEETYLTETPSSYVSCSSASACASTTGAPGTTLAPQGIKITAGDKVAVAINTNAGFCAVALSTTGIFWVWDSAKGGLQPPGGTSAPSCPSGIAAPTPG